MMLLSPPQDIIVSTQDTWTCHPVTLRRNESICYGGGDRPLSDLAALMNYPALKLPILGLMNGGEIIHSLLFKPAEWQFSVSCS